MAKIIAVANQKGGVGKTTTCVNLTAALKQMGKNVLLADCDPQGNATTGMGVEKNVSPSMYELLISQCEVFDCIKQSKYGDVIPSGRTLAAASVELADVEGREKVLRDNLKKLYSDYDYIFIDCPPSLDLLTINALVAADSILIPMQCEYYALEGLVDLVNSIKRCKAKLNPSLDIEGIVLTMYDPRANLTLQVAEELKKFMPDKIYKNPIYRSIRLSEAPSFHMPGIIYDDNNKGSLSYIELAKEFVERNK